MIADLAAQRTTHRATPTFAQTTELQEEDLEVNKKHFDELCKVTSGRKLNLETLRPIELVKVTLESQLNSVFKGQIACG